MLVIVSDLHLTDGSSGETINAGAFRVFVQSLANRVRDASWRRDGSFRPVERCDLLLLGDILDVIRSDRWLASGSLRPWSGTHAIATRVGEVTQGILAQNATALAHFRDLNGTLAVPTDRPGEEVNVPLFIHYFVGNHDWFYHVPGSAYDAIRRTVVDAMGLRNDPGKPFPHRIEEASSELQDLLHAHRVHVQHGDIHDPFNYEAQHGRDASSLGDCIVIELLNSFPREVQKALGLGDEEPLLAALREIDNVRPLLAVPRWVNGVLHRYTELPLRDRVMDVWRSRVHHLLGLDFVRDRDRPFRWDTVDTLQLGLGLTGGTSMDVLSRLSDRIERLKRTQSLARHALEEPAIRQRSANYVVYGHTHEPESVPLDLLGPVGAVSEQVYFNSGTWRRTHRACIAHPEQLEFASAHVMTHVAFYRDDERSGRRYETWTGQLG